MILEPLYQMNLCHCPLKAISRYNPTHPKQSKEPPIPKVANILRPLFTYLEMKNSTILARTFYRVEKS